MTTTTTTTMLVRGYFFLLACFSCKMPTRSAVLAASASHPVPKDPTTGNETTKQSCGGEQIVVPDAFDAPFGSYPNLLEITKEERESFSPVVFFPESLTGKSNSSRNKARIDNIAIKDHRQSNDQLAPPEEIAQMRIFKSKNIWKKIWLFLSLKRPPLADKRPWKDRWAIGKYDENRDGGMYHSDLFDDLDNTIDGYGGRRTVHLGIDLGGPVGTPVFAFCDGVVHSVGYNPERGDYGHVVVIEHFWGGDAATTKAPKKRCWALYGHLDDSALTAAAAASAKNPGKVVQQQQGNQWWKQFLPGLGKKPKPLLKPGDAIQKGQVIGHMGDFVDNGGWIHSHLHFQLSTKPPDQPHDMPGASSFEDRTEALRQYPDPRYVLGPMY